MREMMIRVDKNHTGHVTFVHTPRRQSRRFKSFIHERKKDGHCAPTTRYPGAIIQRSHRTLPALQRSAHLMSETIDPARCISRTHDINVPWLIHSEKLVIT